MQLQGSGEWQSRRLSGRLFNPHRGLPGSATVAFRNHQKPTSFAPRGGQFCVAPGGGLLPFGGRSAVFLVVYYSSVTGEKSTCPLDRRISTASQASGCQRGARQKDKLIDL